MKNKKILLAFTTVAFSYLFYQQSSGINFLLFTIIVVSSLLILQPTLVKNKAWIIAALGCVVSAGMILWQHSSLAVIATCCSLILLIGLQNNSQSSIYVGLVQGAASVLLSFFKILFESLNEYIFHQSKKETNTFSISKVTAYFVFPMLITFVFYLLYASANPEFEKYFHLPKDMVSFEFCMFFLMGIVLCAGFFTQFFDENLWNWDISKPNTLFRSKEKVKRKFQLTILKIENMKGMIVLSMLNLLILFFNVVDLSAIFSNQKLPEGLHYSAYVHQGVNTLIFSSLLAISVILYYFRGNQNFYTKNIWLQRLSYLWLFQNTLLLVGVIYKNQLYISEFGLTYKRIGVYVFLILTLSGIISTLWKVYYRKTQWFLLRTNTWFAYTLLILSSLINWDKQIAEYNINTAKQLDITYLFNLSNNTLPALKSLLSNPKVNLNAQVYSCYENNRYTGYSTTMTQKEFILKEIKLFKEGYDKKQWQSWTFEEEQIFKNLNTK